MAPVIALELSSLLILATPSILVLILLWIAAQYLTVKEVVALHELPGPPGGWYSPVGHLPQLLDPDVSPATHNRYTALYGPNFQTFGFGPWDRRLVSLDPAVIKYVLDHQEKYQKGWQAKSYVDHAIGKGGLVMAEGYVHKVMRRLLQPVFSKKNLDALSPISQHKARELCSIWSNLVSTSPPMSAPIDVVPWLTRATFDVIGLAGFGYAFNALAGAQDPLYMAFQRLFGSISGFTFRMYLGIYLPWLDEHFPDERVKAVRESRTVIDSTVKQWVRQRQAEIAGEKYNPRSEDSPKDLLTLMIQEIHSAAPKSPMPDDLVIAQVNTFLLAGSETTSLTISWALYYLATHPQVQSALRRECFSIDPDAPSAFVEGIDRLPLLEKVIRETLRLTPPVHSTMRQAQEDDIIPLSSASLSASEGAGGRNQPTGISIRKGQYVHVPYEGFNTLKSVWGEDSHQFKPERWDALLGYGEQEVGMDEKRGLWGENSRKGRTGWKTWAGLMSFSSGPKACIGMRFALIEVKIFLFHLVRTFHFTCPKPIVKRNAMLVRPIVDGENEKGQQLPLIMRLVTPEDVL